MLTNEENHKPPATNLLGVIFDRDWLNRVEKVMEYQHVFFTLVTFGHGTANSRILGYLGLGEHEKAILLSVLPAEKAVTVLEGLDKLLDFKQPGNGVAFRSKIHKGCYRKFVSLDEESNEGVDMDISEHAHDLIIVIINRGYTEEVMDAAREAGATGGTVLHARGCGLSGAEKFFGITIQPEKEVMFILAKADISCGIMQSISDKVGPGTDSNAVSFSMPISDVRGIGADVPEEIAKK